MDLASDVRTLEELKRNTSHVIRDLSRNRRPVIITRDGEPDMVIIPAEMMSRKLTALKATCELAHA
mgnify:CR=1 FL=1|jgi:prevent-host-death family protein